MKRFACAGVLLLVSMGLLITLGPTAEGYVSLGYRWITPTTTFYVDIPDYDGRMTTAFIEAMERWNAATIFTFLVERIREDPCATGNSRNGVGLSETNCGEEFPTSTLASTTSWTYQGRLTESNIVFNNKYVWGVYDEEYIAGTPDFRRIAVHELGHSLGLGHENNIPSIMTQYISHGDKVVRPTADDIAGVASLYANDLSVPSRPPSPAYGLGGPLETARHVSLTPTLWWHPSSRATSYDLYFGTQYNPPFVGNTTKLSWSPGTLDGETIYHWKVIARNSSGTTSNGLVWYFQTRGTTGPVIESLSRQSGRPGETVEATITGINLEKVKSVHVSGGGINTTILPMGRTEINSLLISLTIAPDASPGWRSISVTSDTRYGEQYSEPFDGFIVQSSKHDQEFRVDLAAGYYTAEVTLLPHNTLITVPGGKKIEAELATTQEQQVQGLTNYPNLAPLTGMLYVYPRFSSDLVHSTKGMEFPLDILWINHDGTVFSVTQNAPPCALTTSSCPLYKGGGVYVLEINANEAATLGIKQGVKLSFELPVELVTQKGKAGFWGLEMLSDDRVLSGGFNLGGGFNSQKVPGFGGFLTEKNQSVSLNVSAQPLPGQPEPPIQLSLLDANGKTIAGPVQGSTSVGLKTSPLDGFFTARVVRDSGKGTFQLRMSADYFSAGVVIGGYLEHGLVGFGGFNLPRPTSITVRLYNSSYGPAASGRVQLRLLDISGQVIPHTH